MMSKTEAFPGLDSESFHVISSQIPYLARELAKFKFGDD